MNKRKKNAALTLIPKFVLISNLASLRKPIGLKGINTSLSTVIFFTLLIKLNLSGSNKSTDKRNTISNCFEKF
jgi:hypothetical protein